MSREKLPNRRAGFTLNVPFGQEKLHASFGLYPDGRLGEVFVSGPKVGSDTRIVALEASVAASFALQHGANVQDLLAAMPIGVDGAPEGLLGAVLQAWLAYAAEVNAANAL